MRVHLAPLSVLSAVLWALSTIAPASARAGGDAGVANQDFKVSDTSHPGAMTSHSVIERADGSQRHIRRSSLTGRCRDAEGPCAGALRGASNHGPQLQLEMYDKHDAHVAIVRCSTSPPLVCDIVADADPGASIATVREISENSWDVSVHRNGRLDQNLLELAPLAIRDYARAIVHHRAVLHDMTP